MKFAPRWLFPLFSALIPLVYVHSLHALHLWDYVPSRLLISLLFLPVLVWEWRWSRWFDGRVAKLWMALRLFFWTAFFVFWVLIVGYYSNLVLGAGEEWKWLKWVGPKIYVNIWLVLAGCGPITAVAAVLWGMGYFYLTVRQRRWRLATGILLPAALLCAEFAEFYVYGGVGGFPSSHAITSQPGVRQLFSVLSLSGQTTVRNHPRDICVDDAQATAIMSFGCTLCPTAVRYPSLVQVDLRSGSALNTFYSGPIREFDCPPGPFMAVAPWQDEQVFGIRKADLATAARFRPDYRSLVEIWEPMASVYDTVTQRIFLVNDVEPAVSAIDVTTGKFLGGHNLWREGLTEYGLAAQALIQPVAGGKLYFTAGEGENLFEMDPFSLALRHIPLGDGAGTALASDGERIWYQASLSDDISEVRIADFTVLRTLPGERFSRGLSYDKGHNVLYVLGYFTGKLSAINLDNGERLWSVSVGGRPNSMDIHGDIAWINSMAGLIRVDLSAVWASHP